MFQNRYDMADTLTPQQVRPPPQVLCVGNVVADIVERGAPVQATGELQLVPTIELHPGGCGLNTATALSRLGVQTELIGCLGEDALGEFLWQHAQYHHISAGLRRVPGHATGAAVVRVSQDGERRFTHALGANQVLTNSMVVVERVAPGGFLHLGGAFLLPGLLAEDGQPMAVLLAAARAQGLRTSLDSAWDPSGRWLQALRPVLAETDYFFPNMAEAQALSGEIDPYKAVEALLRLGVRQAVVVTLGKAGCLMGTVDGQRLYHATPIIQAVDATGAGDVFVAGFLAGLVYHMPLDQALRLGGAAGTLSAEGLGSMGKLENWAQVQALADVARP
jgi:sugar/nucleoside kinase (ribokinase family)